MLFNIDDITMLTYNSIKQNYDEGVRDFAFNIDSGGGDFNAALKIYDLLRGDPECVVSARVDGLCMSAATILLLAAPLERRSATQHSIFMCHSPLMPFAENVNLETANQLKDTIQSAYDELVSIYKERTNSEKYIIDYMKAERQFYSKEANKLGFINNIEQLYNRNNRMSRIRNLVNSILMQLKNEKFITVDNIEFEALAIEVGAPVDGLQDGVYELLSGEVITVDKGIIIDVIPKPEETVETAEAEPTVEAEAEVETEPAVEEVSVAEAKETVVETVEEVVEQIETAVSEEEIKEAVEAAIAELKQELENKYKDMVELVNSVGGTERLITLKNTMSEQKSFKSEVKNTKKSLNDLMAMVNK